MGYITLLFGWMPLSLQLLCGGVTFLFSLIAIIRLVTFIKNMIPFL